MREDRKKKHKPIPPPISTVKNLPNFRELWGIKNPTRKRGLKIEEIKEFVNVMNLNRSLAHNRIIMGSTKTQYTEVDGGFYGDERLNFTNDYSNEEKGTTRDWKKDINKRFDKMNETRARSESIVRGIVSGKKVDDR